MLEIKNLHVKLATAATSFPRRRESTARLGDGKTVRLALRQACVDGRLRGHDEDHVVVQRMAQMDRTMAAKIYDSREILEDAVREGLREICSANHDLGLGIVEEAHAIYLVGRRKIACQLTLRYRDFFCRVIDWAAIMIEFPISGLNTNIDDNSRHVALVRRGQECVERVERAATLSANSLRKYLNSPSGAL